MEVQLACYMNRTRFASSIKQASGEAFGHHYRSFSLGSAGSILTPQPKFQTYTIALLKHLSVLGHTVPAHNPCRENSPLPHMQLALHTITYHTNAHHIRTPSDPLILPCYALGIWYHTKRTQQHHASPRSISPQLPPDIPASLTPRH